jgi:transcriptional regulator with XRE-family HTH domain
MRGLKKVDTHLKNKLKDPYFKELYELEQQKLKIAKKIIQYRIKHNLTQRQLAKRIGITQQHLSKIENGEFSNILTLEKILLFIGYKVKIKVVPLPEQIIKRISPSKITKLHPQAV